MSYHRQYNQVYNIVNYMIKLRCSVHDNKFEGDSNTADCEKKFIVFDSCLSKLLKRCPECGEVIAQCEKKTTGSMLPVQLTCHSGHMINWDSQPATTKVLVPCHKRCLGSGKTETARYSKC